MIICPISMVQRASVSLGNIKQRPLHISLVRNCNITQVWITMGVQLSRLFGLVVTIAIRHRARPSTSAARTPINDIGTDTDKTA